MNVCMTVFTENATSPKSTTLTNSEISWYLAVQIQIEIWFNLNLYRGIQVSGFGGFLWCTFFSGNCHVYTQTLSLFPSLTQTYIFSSVFETGVMV